MSENHCEGCTVPDGTRCESNYSGCPYREVRTFVREVLSEPDVSAMLSRLMGDRNTDCARMGGSRSDVSGIGSA